MVPRVPYYIIIYIYTYFYISVWIEVGILGVLTVNLLTPILIFSFQSASFSWKASYIKTDKRLK